MASGKISPRQKMIGMMYLVLTALLALNVSKDILDAFVIVNTGLEHTINNFEEKNVQLYSSFDEQRSLDPKKVTPYWEKAQQAKKLSLEMYAFIVDLKKQIIMETEGLLKNEADTMQLASTGAKDNYDIPTNIMIGISEDGSKGASRELKDKINLYKNSLLKLVDPADKPLLKLNIDTEDPARSENNENWENHNFYNTPMAAVVTILTKMQTDIKNAETETVTLLLKKIHENDLKFDTVAAKVIAMSNYVLLGEEYKADVFIAAFNKTINPVVLTGDYDKETGKFNGNVDSIPVSRGQGKYTMKTTREGFVKWGGTISLKSPKGNVLSYPFESEFIVARPSLTVSAEKMNVMYAGVVNPVSISVPGVPNERLTVSISNGKLKAIGGGKFEVTGVTAGTAVVNVTATMENGEKKNMGSTTFKTKNLPRAVAKIGELTDDGKMTKGILLSQRNILSYYENFEFQATCNVTEFTVTVTTRNIPTTKTFRGNVFTDEVKAMFNSLKKFDKVEFEYIKAMGPDNLVRKLNPLTITIN